MSQAEKFQNRDVAQYATVDELARWHNRHRVDAHGNYSRSLDAHVNYSGSLRVMATWPNDKDDMTANAVSIGVPLCIIIPISERPVYMYTDIPYTPKRCFKASLRRVGIWWCGWRRSKVPRDVFNYVTVNIHAAYVQYIHSVFRPVAGLHLTNQSNRLVPPLIDLILDYVS